MADFIDSEAEESEEEEELTEKDKRKLKALKNASDSDEDDEDDEEKLQEELKDLIDDNPIEEESSSSSESEEQDVGGKKRKRHDDDELDDRLSDEDFDLIEENLGIKVKRKKTLRRIKRIDDDDSDEDTPRGREAIASELFEGSDGEDDRRERRERVSRGNDEEEGEKYSDEEEEDEEDIGDFIVDADGQPIHGKRKKRKAIYTDAALQEAQDIFGVDFDYEDFNQEEEYEDEDEEEYEDEDGVRKTRKKTEKTKKKSQRKTIYDVYEPSELERGHFTDMDEKIRKTDIPERMQLRNVPIVAVEEGSPELKQEADWIYKHAFAKASISNQEAMGGRDRASKGPQTVEKIRTALDFMRNQHFEVPFIAFYRKEYVQPELTVNDLWRVYKFDEKWTQLQTRKKNMMRLFTKMQKYQSEKLTSNVNASIPENVRILKDEDIDRLRSVQSLEELNDVYNHFILYYGNEVPAMQEAMRQKEKEEARERRSAARRRQNEDGEPMEVDDFGGDLPEAEDEVEAMDEDSTIKQAKRSDLYSLCTKAGLDGLVRKYGLSPEQFAENLRDNYQRHEVEQYPSEPSDTAMAYVSAKFPTPSEVLKAANYMMAVQIAKEPIVRQCVREAFHERARVDITPTKQGIKEIDENHPLYSLKFIKDKPVRDLSDDQFLRLVVGEQDKLITINFKTNIEGATSSSYIDEVKQLFQRDEFSKLVQEWNDMRNQVVEIALNKFIFPALVKEIKAKLANEGRDYVMKSCCHQLYNWLKVAPYRVDFADEEDEWDTKSGIRAMALSYVADLDQAAFGCVVDTDGQVMDHIRLEHILKRKNAWNERDREGKERDLTLLRKFIRKHKPHVIAVSGESREATMLIEDLRSVTTQLVEDEQWPSVNVELVDNNLAKVFANSTRAENEFREYPLLLREAVSLARLLQDPLVEYSQLCNADDEILCLKYHPMQDQLSKEELLESLQLEFVNRTNEVGVDINRAINYPHTANLVQFICGLGPRKGAALLKILKQNSQRLENRTQLVTSCHMGPKVFINCAGFIKIDTNSLGDSTESYVEVLDGSRVHPETYEWARKMAVDALEYDDEDANPAGAVEEILEAPERLKDLDLDAFADELERQGYGNKRITLYDIRSELSHRYKDMRAAYQAPSPEEIFNMVTKETPQTFYIGKLVMATVTGFQHRKPQREELDRANPNRNESGLWQCPFCTQNDFADLGEVWNHFDAGSCPGKAVGVRIRLENGLSGFIPLKSLSDSEVTNPEQRVRPGQTIHCRITKVDVEKFSVTATSRSSDLMDKKGEWKPQRDPYYDTNAEEGILRAEEESKKQKTRQSYTRRVIVHPSFKNISFKEAEKLMGSMEQGEVIVRPSSKGTNHLTVTWKVGEGVCQHVDVREEGKENAFSLGQSLWINDEEFEDLDEIIARYINPMAGHARDLYSFRYYRDLGISEEAWAPGKEREKADEIIKDDKKKNPSKIHYFVSASREFPGKFMLTYLPRAHAKHEFITVTPEGFRFRGHVHDSLASLFKWFKEHFRDPIPGTPRGGQATSSRTPSFGGTGTTPNVNPETLQRVAQTMPTHMLQSLSQAAHFQGTPTPFGFPPNTPYTPSGQTPFMTPYAATPHQPQTPRHSGTSAPQANASGQGVFRTPAAPGAARGYGSQPQSSPFNRPASANNKSTASDSAADWGLSASDTWGSSGEPKSTSRSAAPAASEPDDWNAATNAWATSTRAKGTSAAGSRSGGSRSGDDWGTKSNSWGANSRGRSTPSSQNKSSTPATDDWGIPDEPSGAPANAAPNAWSTASSNNKPTTPRSSQAANSADDWGLTKDDAWGTKDGGSSNSKNSWGSADNGSNKADDWGTSSSSKNNSWGSSSAPRGGSGAGGGKRTCYRCNQEGHLSRDCPNPGNSSRPNPRSRPDTQSSSQSATDDWGIQEDPPATSSAPAASNEWDTGANSNTGNSTSDWGSASTAWGATKNSGSDSWGAKKDSASDSWGAKKDAAPDSWGSKKDSGSDSWGAKKDSWGSSSGNAGGRGPKGGPGNRACFKCNQEGHISRDCPNSSSGGGGGSGGRTCYKCNQEGHISRECPSSSGSGGGGGGGGSGGGSRACFKCNQEGHISRDCPNPGSGRSTPRSRGGNDDWGSKSSSSSPWATGANATPRGAAGRSTPSASKTNDDWGISTTDSWGSSSSKTSNDRSRPSNQSAAADDWGLSSTDSWGSAKNSADKPKSTTQTASADDWGLGSSDGWGSSSSKTANDRSRSTSQSAAADDWGLNNTDTWGTSANKNPSDRSRSAMTDEIWDTGDSQAAAPGDDWGVTSAPGTSSDGQKNLGDATPLYDE